MCNCIHEINKRLEEEQPDNNTEIQVAFNPMHYWAYRTMVVVKKRGIYNETKPRMVLAEYCPFCGKAYFSEPIIPQF